MHKRRAVTRKHWKAKRERNILKRYTNNPTKTAVEERLLSEQQEVQNTTSSARHSMDEIDQDDETYSTDSSTSTEDDGIDQSFEHSFITQKIPSHLPKVSSFHR